MKLKAQSRRDLVLAILLSSSIAPAETREYKLPLLFEINRGQTDQRVKFLSRGKGYTLFLTPAEAVLSLRQWPARTRGESNADVGRRLDTLRIKLVGANIPPKIVGLDQLPGKSNYFIGDDPKKWQTGVPIFSKVKYESVYPGIDLIYYGNQGQLEHDFIVAPGANPKVIRLSIRGATKARIDSDGNLLLSISGGTVCLHRPRIYQDVDGIRQPVMGGYVIKGESRLGFEIDEYDVNKPLTIDPALSYSTYLGGNNDDIGNAIAVDSTGNAYVTGETASTNFPTAGAIQPTRGGAASNDVFVTKLNATGGALVYSTYLGGSGEDLGFGIAVDLAGNAYVTGQTASTNFPTRNPLQPSLSGGTDGFVTKLNANGSDLMYSTYLGGSGDDFGAGIAVDSAGNAYTTGTTNSTNFPTTPAAWQTMPGLRGPCGFQPNTFPCRDAFVTKLNANGSALLYSTYLAGDLDDVGTWIALGSSGEAYATGFTNSPNFRATSNAFQVSSVGGYDAFVVKLNAGGSGPVYATYLGGATDDRGFAIAVDSAGSAYVTGRTDSTNFPTKNPFQAVLAQGSPLLDAFVTKFDSVGTLVYSTYLGGNAQDIGFGIAVDSIGNAYVTGRTDSTDFPTERPIQASPGSGPGSGFVTALNAGGTALVYSTYLAGDGLVRGFGIALDSNKNAYVTGFTDAANYPTTPGVFQAASRGMADAIVSKIDDSTPDFTVALASGSNSASVTCGQTANYDLQVVPLNGFTGTVGVSCALVAQGMGSVQGLTCRPSAASVSVAGGPARFGVSVISVGRSVVPPMASYGRSDGERVRPGFAGILVLLLLSILVGLFAITTHSLKARLTAGGAVIALLLVVAELSGCGKGGDGNRAQPGNYAVAVMGTTQAVTRSLSLRLTVDCPR